MDQIFSYNIGEQCKHSESIPSPLSFFNPPLNRLCRSPTSPIIDSNRQGETKWLVFVRKCIPSPPSEDQFVSLGFYNIMVDGGLKNNKHYYLPDSRNCYGMFNNFLALCSHHPQPSSYILLSFFYKQGQHRSQLNQGDMNN